MIKITDQYRSGYSIIYPIFKKRDLASYSDANRVESLAPLFLMLNLSAIAALVFFRENETIVDITGFSLAVYAFVRRHAILKYRPDLGVFLKSEIAPTVVIADYITFPLAFSIFFGMVSFFVSPELVIFGLIMCVLFFFVSTFPILNIVSSGLLRR